MTGDPTIQQILSLLACGWFLFILGFFTAALVAAAKRGENDSP